MSMKLRDFMTLEQERIYYAETLARVINNPRFYLDNLDDLDVYYTSIHNYQPIDKYNPNQYIDSEDL